MSLRESFNRDPVTFLMSAAVVIIVVLCILAFLVAIKSQYEESKFKERNNCVLKAQVETGNTVYCGKACYRQEVKSTYACSFGIYTVIR